MARWLKKRSVALPPVFALWLMCAYAVYAQAPDLTRARIIVPDAIPGVKTLTAEQVIQHAIEEDDLIIIDARIREDRIHGYIESSVSLPDIHTNCDSLKDVVSNRQRPVLFYCNGVKCGRSVVSIKVALSCGYSNLHWFKGGFEEWKDKGYPYINER